MILSRYDKLEIAIDSGCRAVSNQRDLKKCVAYLELLGSQGDGGKVIKFLKQICDFGIVDQQHNEE